MYPILLEVTRWNASVMSDSMSNSLLYLRVTTNISCVSETLRFLKVNVYALVMGEEVRGAYEK